MVIAKPFKFRCPRCREVITHYTEILFVDGFLIVVNGVCCGYEITSGEIPILSLFSSCTQEKTH